MHDLAEQERFEEAALARDRLRALAEALARRRIDGWLLAGDDLVLRHGEDGPLRLRRGALARGDRDDDEPLGQPCPRERADELSALRSWIVRHEVRIETTDVPLVEPVDGGAALSRILEAVRGTSSVRDRPG